MNALAWAGLFGATVLCLSYQVYITRRITQYSTCTSQQKALQTTLVWLLPLIGAAVVHAFFKLDAAQPRPRDSAFTPEVGHDGGTDVGHGGDAGH